MTSWLAGQESNLQLPEPKSGVLPIELPANGHAADGSAGRTTGRDRPGSPWAGGPARVTDLMGSLIKKRRKRMRKKKHKKMLKRTRFQRRAAGK